MVRVSASQAKWIRDLARRMPYYKHLGMTLTRLSLGGSEMKMKVRRELTQDAGFAHGGSIASIVDSVVGLALCTMLKPQESITTIELKVNFVAPAKLGWVRGRGRILHKGRTVAVGEAEVIDETGKLIAKGLVTYIVIGKRNTRAQPQTLRKQGTF